MKSSMSSIRLLTLLTRTVSLPLAIGLVIGLIPSILGLGCGMHRLIVSPEFIVQKRPEKVPAMIDGSPKPCPECESVEGQRMWKMTERDFLQDKKKHIEKDDYIDYLLFLVTQKSPKE